MEPNLTDDGPIDFAYIKQVMEENPDDWHTEEEAERRFNAITLKMLGKSDDRRGPC